MVNVIREVSISGPRISLLGRHSGEERSRMRRRRYRSQHSEDSRPGSSAPEQPARRRPGAHGKIYGLLAGLVVIAIAVTAAALHSFGDAASNVSLTGANCGAASGTSTDAADTLLGVSATTSSQLKTVTAEFGQLPIIRVYYLGMPDPDAWTSGTPARNHSAVVVSFRSPPAKVLSGADDAALAHFFDAAPTGHPIYYSYYHEPEPLIEAGDFTLPQYKAAWTHIVALADQAHNPYLKSILILMAWDLTPAAGVNWKDYLPAGHVISTLSWDAYPAGSVHDRNPQPTPPAAFMGPAEAASRSVGLPFGFAEFALATQANRPQWLAEVANYLRRTGALFGTLFDSEHAPWLVVRDSASIQAWRTEVAGSRAGVSVSGSPSPRSTGEPSSPEAGASSPPPSTTATRRPAVISATAAPVITDAQVNPEALVANGADHVVISYKLSRAATVTVCVLSSQGSILHEQVRGDLPAGQPSMRYFGYGASGSLLPPGHYRVLIVARNSAGTGTTQAELRIRSGQ
jgi:hypothetical protein